MISSDTNYRQTSSPPFIRQGPRKGVLPYKRRWGEVHTQRREFDDKPFPRKAQARQGFEKPAPISFHEFSP